MNSQQNPRTEEELVAMLADLGSQDEATARRMLNFIALGQEHKLARLDALAEELGYFGKGARLRLMMLRDNQVAIEGKARSDLLLGIGEKAAARFNYPMPRTTEKLEDKK